MVRCPSCGRENEPYYRFCLGCGQSLDAARAGGPSSGEAESHDSSPAGRFAGLGGSWALGAAEGVGALAVESLAGSPGRACSCCGQAIHPGFTFCGNCGARYLDLGGHAGPAQPNSPASPPPVLTPNPGPVAGGRGAAVQGRAAGELGAVGPRATAGPAAADDRSLPRRPNVPPPQAWLVQIRSDGREGGQLPVPATGVCTGRTSGGQIFEGDPFLSPLHATFWIDPQGRVMVRDEGSLNGTFLRVREPCPLVHGDVFRIGQELVRFEALRPGQALHDDQGTQQLGSPAEGCWGRLVLLLGLEQSGDAHLLSGRSARLGRERGEIVFPEDGFVSGLHAELDFDGTQVLLHDLGSSNGTFLRLRAECPLQDGDFLLLGQQLFLLRLNPA